MKNGEFLKAAYVIYIRRSLPMLGHDDRMRKMVIGMTLTSSQSLQLLHTSYTNQQCPPISL